ncbi:hypothetical protein [Borrelia sp. RT1S]|uniref:hypothetical protein n=1 Tax=Borrelia sp. RT1S TaxID=2898580 RepID=UPI001E29BFDE|nr:hypothetical protein [Borrelia sp. RT1S]UGQ18006.1 hypothetical protein LSO05_06115 [Borrelia sp. RT1S]
MKKFEMTMFVLFTVLMISCGNDLPSKSLQKELGIGSKGDVEQPSVPAEDQTPAQHHPIVAPLAPTAEELALEARKEAARKAVKAGSSAFGALADEAKQKKVAKALEARREKFKKSVAAGASAFGALADEAGKKKAAKALEARKEEARKAVKAGSSAFEVLAADEAKQKAAAKPAVAPSAPAVGPKQPVQQQPAVAPAGPAAKTAATAVQQLPAAPIGQAKLMSGVFQRFVKQPAAGAGVQGVSAP